MKSYNKKEFLLPVETFNNWWLAIVEIQYKVEHWQYKNFPPYDCSFPLHFQELINFYFDIKMAMKGNNFLGEYPCFLKYFEEVWKRTMPILTQETATLLSFRKIRKTRLHGVSLLVIFGMKNDGKLNITYIGAHHRFHSSSNK